MNSIRTLETCLEWQRVVLMQSKDAKQQERARQAIAKLTKQIQDAKK